MSRLLQALRTRVVTAPEDGGMSTAEYCVGIVAVCAFAAVLYRLLSGNLGQDLITGLITRALSLVGL